MVEVISQHWKYPIVCLCGSSKQKADWEKYAHDLALKGYCVLNINVYLGLEKDNYNVEDDQKMLLEALHEQKILMSDFIAIIRKPDGTVGDHTLHEMIFATEHKKPVYDVIELLGR